MSDPRKTGISSITGKIVSIRHATDTDRVIVAEYLKQHHSDSDLMNAEVVVAAEDERIIGFGVLKKENDAGCVSLFEDSRRRGIGSTIVNHLMEYASVQRVYAARYASYFTRSGFRGEKNAHAARSQKSGKLCDMPLMERLSVAAYKKS